jgi:hypothetical protein
MYNQSITGVVASPGQKILCGHYINLSQALAYTLVASYSPFAWEMSLLSIVSLDEQYARLSSINAWRAPTYLP